MERIIILSHANIALAVPEKDDLEIMLRAMNNIEVANFLSLNGPRGIFSRPAEEKWLEEELAKPGHFMVIYLLDEKRVVGGIDLHAISKENRNAELGVTLYDHEKLGKGIGTKAIRLMMQYAFELQGFHKVTLWVRGDNVRGIRCYEKCGFHEMARQKEHVWVLDHYEDSVGMELLRSEYLALKADWFI